jgi:hypothetical protein
MRAAVLVAILFLSGCSALCGYHGSGCSQNFYNTYGSGL